MIKATFDRKTGKLISEKVAPDPNDKTMSELAADYVDRMWRICPPEREAAE